MARWFFESLVVFLMVVSIYLAAPVTQMLDSKYVLVVSQSLIDHGSFKLDPYFGDLKDYSGEPIPHGMHVVNQHVYYWFPDGPAILSVPYVAMMNLFGISAIDAEGRWAPDLEERMQRGLAAILTAGLVVLLFRCARFWLPTGWSLAVAAVAAFGTSLFSSASRGLWSLTWGTFLLGAVVLMLARLERGKNENPYLLATLLSWTYFARPTNSISVLLVSVFILLYHRRLFIRYAATGIAWGAVFAFYSMYNFGTLLPTYYRQGLGKGDPLWYALSGVLMSPSRGLLVFSPIFILTFYLVIRYRKNLRSKRLCWLAAAGFCGHLLLVSLSPDWIGGHCYGPRLMTDALPWLIMMTILGIDAATGRRISGGSGSLHGFSGAAFLFVAVVLISFSFFTHARGAFVPAVHEWNVVPERIEKNRARVWSWRNPQFLIGLGRTE